MHMFHLDCFFSLQLSAVDKKIGRDVHPPVNGVWPKKHANSSTNGSNGGSSVAVSLRSIAEK